MSRIILLTFLLALCGNMVLEANGKELKKMKFQLFSPAFAEGKEIPDVYSCTRKGKNLSPPLVWKNPPPGTKSYAIIVDDLSISFFTFTHWLIYNIPAEKRELPEGIPQGKKLRDGIRQVRNGYWQYKYVGPHPLDGETHQYCFKIYALDIMIKPQFNLNRKKFLRMIEGHILGQAQLTGRYAKK